MKVLGLVVLHVVGYMATGYDLHVENREVPLPAGDVIGAAFYSLNRVFIQQSRISTENAGLLIRSQRVITYWDTKTMSPLGKRDFGFSPEGTSSSHPCGRVASIPSRGWLIICSAETHLDVLDATSLVTLHTIGVGTNQNIYDFVVDQVREKVYVISLQLDRSTHLTAYSLSDGTGIEETGLPFPATGGLKLALEPKSGNVIAVDVYEAGHRDKSHVFVCAETPFSCTSVASVEPISEMSLLGRQLLFAVRTSANDKRDCIYGVSLSGGEIRREYCAPSTGVRFAVGVITGQYIVGFTGTTKNHAFQEVVTSAQSSFTIWKAEVRMPVAVFEDPTDYGSSQYQMRIEPSEVSPQFLTYNWVTNTVYVHTIIAH